MREHLIKTYLDWVNNYLTVETFADHYGLQLADAEALIKVCRNVYYNQHPEA